MRGAPVPTLRVRLSDTVPARERPSAATKAQTSQSGASKSLTRRVAPEPLVIPPQSLAVPLPVPRPIANTGNAAPTAGAGSASRAQPQASATATAPAQAPGPTPAPASVQPQPQPSAFSASFSRISSGSSLPFPSAAAMAAAAAAASRAGGFLANAAHSSHPTAAAGGTALTTGPGVPGTGPPQPYSGTAVAPAATVAGAAAATPSGPLDLPWQRRFFNPLARAGQTIRDQSVPAAMQRLPAHSEPSPSSPRTQTLRSPLLLAEKRSLEQRLFEETEKRVQENTQYLATIDELKKQVRLLETDRDELRKQLTAARTELSDFQSALSELRSGDQVIRAKLEQMRNAQEEEQASAQRAAERQRQQYQTELSNAASEAAQWKRAANEIFADKTALERRTVELREELERVRLSAIASGEELLSARVQLNELRTQHDELRQAHQDQIGKTTQLADRVELLDEAIRQWKAQHDEIVEYYQRELAAADARLQQVLSDRSSSSDETAQTAADIVELRARAETMAREAQERLELLEKQQSVLDTRTAQVAADDQRLAALQAQLVDRERAVAEKDAELRTREHSLAEREEAVNQRLAELSEREREWTRRQQDAQSANREQFDGLLRQYRSVLDERVRMGNSLRLFQQENATLRAEVTAVSLDLRELQGACATLTSHLAALRREDALAATAAAADMHS